MKLPEGTAEATRGGAVRLAAEVPIRGLSILAILVLTHRLGVHGFGELVALLGVGMVIAEFSDLGLSHGMMRSVVGAGTNVGDILVVKGGLTAATLALTGAALWAIPEIPGLDSTMVALCVLHYVGFSWIEFLGSALRAHGRIWAEAGLLLVSRGTVVALIGLTSFGDTPRLVSIAYALAILPGLLIGGVLVLPQVRERQGGRSWSILREALPLGVNGFLGRLTVRVEVFVLRTLDLATGLGLFAATLRIIESLLTLPAAFSAGALPTLAREAASKEHAPGAAQRTMGMLAWLGIPAAIGLGMRAPEILALLGSGFGEAAPLLQVFAPTLAFCFLNTGLYYILIAGPRSAVIPRLTVMRVAVGILAAVLLIPRLGALGAAIGYAVAEAILFACMLRAAAQTVSLSILRPILLALLGTAPMALALWVGPRDLSVAIPMGVAIFALSAFLISKVRPLVTGLESRS